MKISEILFEEALSWEDKINRLIQQVNAGEMSSQELIQLKKNAEEKPGTEKLIQTIEIYLRRHDNRAANREYGRKDRDVTAKLKEIDDYIRKKYPLSDNVHKSGVKPGGDMIGGIKFLDYFISYKNPDGLSPALGIVQDSPESEVKWVVSLRMINRRYGTATEMEKEEFPFKEARQALSTYEKYIKEVL